MLVLKGLDVFIEPFNFSFFSITGWGIDLDYCDIEWFALETNRDHSVIFEITSKYCILDSLEFIHLHIPHHATLVAQVVKNLPAMLKTWVRSLGWEDPLEKGMITHATKHSTQHSILYNC